MSANRNWSRWIFASISKHFQDKIDATFNSNPGGVVPKLYIEGDERITADLEQYFELRMDGPSFKELDKDFWIIDIEINILVTAKKNSTDFSTHLIYDLAGMIVSAFKNGIKVYKYGDRDEDDQSFLECLQLHPQNAQDAILVTYLGDLGPDVTVTQAAVEAFYRMHLDSTPVTGV